MTRGERERKRLLRQAKRAQLRQERSHWIASISRRGARKRLLRQATQARIRLERTYLLGVYSRLPGRIEENHTLSHLTQCPSVFALAEKLNPKYDRPLWASHRYGAK